MSVFAGNVVGLQRLGHLTKGCFHFGHPTGAGMADK